jgi:hypothetical protein
MAHHRGQAPLHIGQRVVDADDHVGRFLVRRHRAIGGSAQRGGGGGPRRAGEGARHQAHRITQPAPRLAEPRAHAGLAGSQ